MSTNQLTTAVTRLIAQEQQTTKSLIEILEHEKSALCHRETALLNDCIKKKSGLIAELNRLSNYRKKLLHSMQLEDGIDGWEKLLTQIEQESGTPVKTQWTESELLIKRADTLNQVNGKIINRTKQTVQRILNIVRGQPETIDLYNNAGRSTTNYGRSNSAPVVRA